MTNEEMQKHLKGEPRNVHALEMENVSRLGTPFGRNADLWQKLKEQMQPGDHVYEFCTDRDSWMELDGRAGVALVRDGRVVYGFTTVHT